MNHQIRSEHGSAGSERRQAVRFVVLVGIVSLFADMTYEGARSITGPYLSILGASGLAVGLIAGFGELVGYALRLGSGYLADKTGKYWGITILGYVLNLFSVPLLALTGRWEFAAGLMITERVGKAIRTPARDAMLSHGTKEIGHGWGFGFHEAMDQTGAVIGPLLVAAVVASGFGYHRAFGILTVPALAAIAVLIAARQLYPRPRDLEVAHDAPAANHLRGSLRLYILSATLDRGGVRRFPTDRVPFRQASRDASRVDSRALRICHGRRCHCRPSFRLSLRSLWYSCVSSGQPYSPRYLPRWCSWEDFRVPRWGWRFGALAWGRRSRSCERPSRRSSLLNVGARRMACSTPPMASPGSSAVR